MDNIAISPIMKKSEIDKLKRHAYRLMPISQANLYKKLKLSSQDGSRLVRMMLNDELARRIKITENSRKTFMLMPVPQYNNLKKTLHEKPLWTTASVY